MTSATRLEPETERRRLDAVRRYDILDTPPDGAFDRIARLAAWACDAPISTITIVDEDRIWFKAAEGVDVDEVGRDPGLCASAVLGDAAYVVTDAAVDPRTLDNPLVRGELGLRFYAAVPLRTPDGHGLGTLNVIAAEPRELTDEQQTVLEDLASLVMDELELRLAARQAVGAESARAASRERERLAAGVSHEMRTPLAALKGIAALEPEALADEAVVDAMRREITQLDWLISQFLDFTALGHESPALQREDLDLEGLARETAAAFEDHRAIEIVGRTDGPAHADRRRTRQALHELCNNAVRFSEPGTAVRLELGGDERSVWVAVVDEGQGMTRERLATAFETFSRDEASTGSGVGLYVARELVRAQDGELTVASDPGVGSRFTLTLPRGGR